MIGVIAVFIQTDWLSVGAAEVNVTVAEGIVIVPLRTSGDAQEPPAVVETVYEYTPGVAFTSVSYTHLTLPTILLV